MVIHSEKSSKQYTNVIDTLARRFGTKVDYSNTDKVMEILGTKDNGQPVADNTLKSRLTAIVNVLKGKPHHDFYYTEFNKITKKLNAKATEPSTYIAKDTDWTWADMKEAFDKAEGHEKLILGLYYLQPPRRLEYIDMLVDSDDNKHNYLVIKPRSMKFVFNTYKTASTFGKQEIPVSKELRKLLLKANPGQLLLNPHSKQVFTDAQFSAYLSRLTKKLVGKEASATAFRHAWISHFLESNPTTDERLKMGKMMAHDVGTQLAYDRR